MSSACPGPHTYESQDYKPPAPRLCLAWAQRMDGTGLRIHSMSQGPTLTSGCWDLRLSPPPQAREQNYCGDALSFLQGEAAGWPPSLPPWFQDGERQNSTKRCPGWGAHAHQATAQAPRGLVRAWVSEEVKPSTLLAKSKPCPSLDLSFPPVQEEVG